MDDTNKSTNGTQDDDSNRETPNIAKHILVFMFILWDSKHNPMKRVDARHSVGKSSGED